MKCPKTFWHKLFTIWRGENKNRIKANCSGGKWRIDYWYNEYYCFICKLHYEVDVKYEDKNN